MSLINKNVVEQYLVQVGFLNKGDQFSAAPMVGGVSSHVWKAVIGNKSYVLKEALPKLNVKVDWFSDPIRIHREHETMEYVSELLPEGTIPTIFHKDYLNHFYIMSHVPEARTWKDILMTGSFDKSITQKIAILLKIIHTKSRCANKSVELKLGSKQFFFELRINPFHHYLMERYPSLSKPISRLIFELTNQPQCLVHGDFSPKNILVCQDGNIVLIDFEVAHWGNPVFDVAYCTAHILLKGWFLNKQEDAAELVHEFLTTYDNGITDLFPHLGLMLLARIDGKSPVNYIDDESLKYRIRKLGTEWIKTEDKNVETAEWVNKYLRS